MRRLLLTVLLVAGGAAVPARSAPMELTGNPCQVAAVDDGSGDWTGVMVALPQKLTHVGASPAVWGTLRCTLQVGGARHSDPDLTTTQGPATPAVAVAPPVPVAFHLGPFEEFGACAQVDVPGEGTYYWAAYGNSGTWSTNPASDCWSWAAVYVVPPWETRLLYAVEHAGDATGALDPVVCPLLRGQAPGAGPVTITPNGDIVVGGIELWYCTA